VQIEVYGANFILIENIDSRKKVYPYILSISVEGGSIITIYLEEKDYAKLKKEVGE